MKRSYTYLKGLLTLALSALTGWMWAEVTSSFGINFRNADAQNIPADTAAGFTKGNYAQPTTWANLNGANGKQTITVSDASYEVTWTASGTYNSGMSTDTLTGKLLNRYLDDVVNSGRTKAAVKVTGLPADKTYTVAIILSGDADNDGFNGKYSPVWLNGEVYSYKTENDVTSLVTGATAKAATTWGNRRKPSAGGPSELIEGKNVMFVEGVTGSTLLVTSAMDSQGVSRLTIAGVQVWVTDTTVTAPAVTAPTDSDVISVNFHSGDGAAADGDGLVAAKKWHNTTGATGTINSLTVVNGDDSAASSGTLTYASKETYQYGTNVTDAFLKGYLDDGAHDRVEGATITATVPFETYSVIVYMATDTGSAQFKPVIVNGTLYAGSATLSSVGYADAKPSMMQNTSICNWGASQTATAVYGTNALRVDGLSGNLTIQAGSRQVYNGIENRGGIAAIQIVNTGDSILANVQKIDWTDKSAEELKVSELPEITKEEVELTLPAGATLIVDEALPTGCSIVINGSNVTVNITNWDIEKSTVESVISGATVTTAYTDTIGVEIDGVTYSYFFRGTTDANYDTVANWYTGKRVMGDQTKWYSVSGNKAPGVGNDMWHYILLDGDMMDTTKVTVGDDGYKTISANTLEGWNLGYSVRNGVHLTATTLNKIQNGGGFTAVWRVDDTSKITIGARGDSQHNHLANYYIDNEEGIVFTEFDIADANYYFDEDGSVKLDGVSGTQTIKAITLDLGTVADGRTIVSRKLIGFNSSSATYGVADGAVTTNVEGKAATEAVSLRNVGEYKFEQKEDGYYVSFVAYAATDEIGDASTWTAKEDTAWSTEANWTWGVPEAGADAVISITTDTTITIPAEGVTVGVLTVNGEGTLTIEGGKITAGMILANTSIVAGEDTLALAPMNIAEGKTVTYTTTTNKVDPDEVTKVDDGKPGTDDVQFLTLKNLTGAGTLVKKGTGVIGLFATATEPAIVVEEGAIYVREVPTTAMNISAKAGAEIRFAAWQCNFSNNANSLKLEGGAQLTLANGSGLAGTITIANAAETAAKICGQSFNDATVAAAITGAGKVEFADGGAFNPTSGADNEFPCQYATTYSGVISGDLQVIISDTSAVTFTGANTYTGGTVITEGVTVTVSNLTSIFGTGDITGAGTVKIAGGTYNGLSFAQYTDANTTIVIPADNTVTGYFNNATWTCAAKIQLDGVLDMTNGFGAGKYTFTGPWAGAGAFSLSNNAPADVVRITGDISDFTGNISVAGARVITFCAATTGTNQKYSGKICVHGDYAYTAKVNGTWSAPVMVENGAKIGGTGTIDNTITFNNGAIIDTSVTATGDVTLNGTVTVSGEAGATVLTCANAESLDLTKFAAPAGLRCVADGNTIKLAVAKVNVTIPAAPANTKWYDADGNVVEAGTIAVDPNTDVTLTLKADEGYVFADGSTSTTVKVNSGAEGATVTTPEVTAATPVAQVGEVKYQTLQAAIAAGTEVTVIADIATDAAIEVTKQVTINLNGKTIKTTEADTEGNGVFWVKNGGDLTLNGEGTINGVGGNIYNIAIWADGGKVTINGGTYTNEGAQDNGPDGAHFDLIYVKNGGEVVINGGTFICETPAWTLNSHDKETGTISVKGGTFKGFNPANCATEGANTNWCDEGRIAVAGEDGYYTVQEGAYVAMIGNEGYTALPAAIAAAADGATITMMADVATDAAIEVAKKVTINLNGKTIKTTANDKSGDGVFYVTAGGDLTIEDEGEGTINGVGGNNYNIAIWANGGKVTINGGTYTNEGATATVDPAHFDLIYVKNGGSVVINGGTFICETPAWTLNSHDTLTGTIAVKGGKFYGFNPANCATEGANTNWCANGYIAVADGDYYTVQEGAYVAQIGNVGYISLPAAIEAAEAGATITMMTDVATDAAIEVAKKVTINLNGKTIKTTANDKSGDGVFYVTAGGDLTIEDEGEGTINGVGGNNYNIAIWANGGKVTINGGTYTNEGATATVDPAHFDLIYVKNGGSVVINDGTFICETPAWTLNSHDTSKGTIAVKGGKFYGFNPANCATEGANTNWCANGYGAALDSEGYYVVTTLVIDEELKADIPAEAIKAIEAAMAEAGVTEITNYAVMTKGGNEEATVDAVADILTVFDVPLAVEDGELVIAYEFGISSVTNEGEEITITASVDENTEIREGVTVVFTVGESTYTATTDGKKATITGLKAGDISGKKITVKATK